MKVHWSISLLLTCSALTSGELNAQSVWQRVYGGHDMEECRAIQVLGPGSFIAVGHTGSFGAGSSDIYVVVMDGDGSPVFTRTWGGSGVEQVGNAAIGPDGDVLIVGFTNSQGAGGYDAFLIKMNASGEVLWERTYGGAGWDFARDILVLDDGGVLFTGETYSEEGGTARAWLCRTDMNGELLWSVTYGQPGADFEAHAITAGQGAGYAIAGSVTNADGDVDAWVAKVDGNGVEEWSGVYGGTGVDRAHHIIRTLDGGYSVVGSTSSMSEYTEGYHFKIGGAGGTPLWEWNWGQIDDQEIEQHLELATGEFLSIGYTRTSGGGGKDMFLLKSSPTGEFVFGRTFGGTEDEHGFSLSMLSDGILSAGYSRSYGTGGKDLYVVRSDLDGDVEGTTVQVWSDVTAVSEVPSEGATVYPNPSAGEFRLSGSSVWRTWRLMDHQGRVIASGKLDPIAKQLRTAVADGVYLLELMDANERRATITVMIQRP